MLPRLCDPHRATCHCGRVELAVSLTGGFATARRCDCSFCRRRGAIALTAPLDGVRIVKGAENLTLYTWGTHAAQHWFCKTCGIYTHHRRRSNPSQYGFNLGCLDGVDPNLVQGVPILDGVNHPADRR